MKETLTEVLLAVLGLTLTCTLAVGIHRVIERVIILYQYYAI